MHLHCANAAGEGRRLRASPAPAEAKAWDQLVAATGRPHLLQTAGWASLKEATGWSARRFVLEDPAAGQRYGLAQVLLRRLPLGVVMAYVPRGPLVADDRLAEAVSALRRALAEERCASLLCDPEVLDQAAIQAALATAGVVRSPAYVQPRRTLLFDLAREPEALLAQMHRKTRQYVHRAERAGVATEETADLGRFLRVLRMVAARAGFAVHDDAYFARLVEAFPGRVHLLMVRVGQDDAGALLVVRFADRAWELYGGWNGLHGEARPFYLLKWRAMLRMRALGVRRYDMWGLAEDEALAGVERFKKGFGGEAVTWVGALEASVNPLLYPLWRVAGRGRLARGALST